MSALRRHLTYANVVATLSAFVVLCGGAAIAADQLAKNSVGKKHLKANAVTTKKIKKNAVTRAKIRNDAVDGSKVPAAALGAAEFQTTGMPYTHIAEEIRIALNQGVPTGGEPAILDLPGGSYTQPGSRTDQYVGAVDVTFDPSCVDRTAVAYLLMDPPDTGGKFGLSLLLSGVAVGFYQEDGNARATGRIELGPFSSFGTRFAPGTATTHVFKLLTIGTCGSGAGITANTVSVDVIGTEPSG
jgi:hypothetical protein